MLSSADVSFEAHPPQVDETGILRSLELEGAKPRDIADQLAEAKARKVGSSYPDEFVIGSDQILDIDGDMLEKPSSIDDARDQLLRLRGRTHILWSAVVVYHDGSPAWRYVDRARMTMRDFSSEWLEAYLDRNWTDIQHCVGCYQIEGAGVRLFEKVEGDYFTILGMPLLPLLNYLVLRGALER